VVKIVVGFDARKVRMKEEGGKRENSMVSGVRTTGIVSSEDIINNQSYELVWEKK
jgi:hypothetical protein